MFNLSLLTGMLLRLVKTVVNTVTILGNIVLPIAIAILQCCWKVLSIPVLLCQYFFTVYYIQQH